MNFFESVRIVFVCLASLSLTTQFANGMTQEKTEESKSVATDKDPAEVQRARDLGIRFDGEPGTENAITDVAGVLVGHSTVIERDGADAARTGVTAIFPSRELHRMFAGIHVMNGNGEMTGRSFIDEWGYLISPIMMTNTISVGTVRDAVIKWAAKTEGTRREINLPVVGETWDGFLNDIRGFHLTEKHVFEALDSAASGPVAEGNVGGGTGMMCHWFKGGIGTSSRKLGRDNGGFTVGVLVQANYGTRGELTIRGKPIGEKFQRLWPERGQREVQEHEDGSIIVTIATDAPLLPLQLKRVAKRATLALGRMGTVGSTESGDIFIAFSTTGLQDSKKKGHRAAEFLDETIIDAVFEATVQATEESIVNALVAAETMTGRDGNLVHAMPIDEVKQMFEQEIKK